MATLIVSWSSTCLVIGLRIQYKNPVLQIQLLISNIRRFEGLLFKQQTRSTSNESYFILTAYTERNLVYILKQFLDANGSLNVVTIYSVISDRSVY